jgi:formamidopyrimidine-DNA glycosylase
MKYVTLQSGKKVLDILADVETAEASSFESTSRALSLDTPGFCPKCGKQMALASACGAPVHWCNSCRVTAPTTIS